MHSFTVEHKKVLFKTLAEIIEVLEKHYLDSTFFETSQYQSVIGMAPKDKLLKIPWVEHQGIAYRQLVCILMAIHF